MEYEEFESNGVTYKWSAFRDSEHPDFVLVCDKGEIWVQVEQTPDLDRHYKLFDEEKVKYPITLGIVQNIISQIVSKGYIETYFTTNVGLIYSGEGTLGEN